MSAGSTRKGFTQAKFNEDLSNLIYGEITILSAVAGFYFSSWYIFGGMVVGLIVCLLIPVVNIITGVILSCLWAIVGATLVAAFQQPDIEVSSSLQYLIAIFSTPASQIIGGSLFLFGLGAHLGAIEWTRDVADPEDRNFS